MATIKLGEFALRNAELALTKRQNELNEMLSCMKSVDCPKDENFWRQERDLQLQLLDCKHALEVVHMARIWKR